jgi:hypothetical protein
VFGICPAAAPKPHGPFRLDSEDRLAADRLRVIEALRDVIGSPSSPAAGGEEARRSSREKRAAARAEGVRRAARRRPRRRRRTTSLQRRRRSRSRGPTRSRRARGTSVAALPPLLRSQVEDLPRLRSIASPTAAAAPSGSACARREARNDLVDDVEALQVRRRDLERVGRFLLRPASFPQDRAHPSGEMTSTRRAPSSGSGRRLPSASAPRAPSPVTVTMIGTGSAAISFRLAAIASAWPRSSASMPG